MTIGGVPITCAAGTHGFNAINNTCNPMDDHDHGTHVSGTIGGVGNNGVGVAGVNWVASIMGAKFLSASGSGTLSNAIKAIEFTIQAKAAFAGTGGANVRVLSNSWGGGGFSQSLLDEINRANSNDMLFVAAAGNAASNNDAIPSYPASYNAPNIIAVAATDNRDRLASFSSYGRTSVHLGAPGVNILSTIPGNAYAYFDGTSMATPHVSGAAALLLARCSLTTAELKTALLTSVDPVAALATTTSTGGRLNVNNAFNSCRPQVTGVSLTSSAPAPQSPGTTITWTATPTGGAAPYQYKWMVYDGTAWTMQAWTSADTFAWTPASSANYFVGVWVKSAGNTSNTAEFPTSAPYAIVAARASSVVLSTDRTSPQPLGSTVNWTATPTGGTAPYQYKWWSFDGTTWTTAGWTTSNTFAWMPAVANANYSVRAWVRSTGNLVDAAETSATVPFVISPPTRVSSVVVTPSVASPQAPGTVITWTAATTGGVTPYQYKWMVFDGTMWTMQPWGAANTFVWTAPGTGSYYVGVWVKSAGNTADAAEAPMSVSYTILAAHASGVALAANLAAPQPLGTTVTWTATPTGGAAPYQYKWFVFDGASWITLTGWATANTLAWTPTSANADYSVRVWVRSAGNLLDGAEAATNTAFAINPPTRVRAVAITSDRATPQLLGSTITFTATPTGGVAPHQYKWMVFDGAMWTMQAWSTANTLAWTPAGTGTYYVGVWVKSAGNLADQAETPAAVPYVITLAPRVGSVGLTANRTAPQLPATTVTWTAAPSGGTAPYEYKWSAFDGTSWSALSGWTSSNTLAWSPSTANANYRVRVWTRSSGNTIDAAEASAELPFAILAPSQVNSVVMAANRTAPQSPGTTITWTATPAGGVAPYQYKWSVFDGSAWSTLTAWTTSNTLAWTPATANAAYVVRVWARSAGNGVDAPEAAATMAFAIMGSTRVSSATLTPDLAAPQAPGATIVWTAAPSGGTGPYQYKWWVYSGSMWTMVMDWTTSSTFTWTPAVSANYHVGVWVRSAGSTADAAEFPISVPYAVGISSGVSGLTLSANRTAPQAPGATIAWTASATGGTTPYQYKWWIHDGTSWSLLQGWTTSNTFSWSPSTANASYSIRVWVRSAGSVTDAAEASSTVPFAIMASTRVNGVSLTPSLAGPQAPGTTITWTAVPSGGTAPYQYKWWVYDGAMWSMMTGWTGSNTFVWTPAMGANYYIGVWVKSAGNAADAAEMPFSVPFVIQ